MLTFPSTSIEREKGERERRRERERERALRRGVRERESFFFFREVSGRGMTCFSFAGGEQVGRQREP